MKDGVFNRGAKVGKERTQKNLFKAFSKRLKINLLNSNFSEFLSLI
jgi:hypothetical protein